MPDFLGRSQIYCFNYKLDPIVTKKTIAMIIIRNNINKKIEQRRISITFLLKDEGEVGDTSCWDWDLVTV